MSLHDKHFIQVTNSAFSNESELVACTSWKENGLML